MIKIKKVLLQDGEKKATALMHKFILYIFSGVNASFNIIPLFSLYSINWINWVLLGQVLFFHILFSIYFNQKILVKQIELEKDIFYFTFVTNLMGTPKVSKISYPKSEIILVKVEDETEITTRDDKIKVKFKDIGFELSSNDLL
jgi:hypothetical protein